MTPGADVGAAHQISACVGGTLAGFGGFGRDGNHGICAAPPRAGA